MKKWVNKQTIISFILGALLFITIPVFAETRTINAFYNNIKLKINGMFIKTDVEPFIVNGRTMVPARFVAESLGATVNYNDKEYCVEIVSDHGIINYSDGAKYIGEISEGLPNGKGVLYWADGTYYTGEFVDGIIEGNGFIVYNTGGIAFGNWINDSIEGNGYYVDSVGNDYSVTFKDKKVVNVIKLNEKTSANENDKSVSTNPESTPAPVSPTPPSTAPDPSPSPTPSQTLTRTLILEYDNSVCLCGATGYVMNRRTVYENGQEYEVVDVRCKNPKCKLYNTIIGEVKWRDEYK